MCKPSRSLFVRSERIGRGLCLFTLPGQTIRTRTPVKPGIVVLTKGDDRKSFPEGTVFRTDSDMVHFRKGRYETATVTPVVLPDGQPASDDLFINEYINEYKTLVSP